MWVGEQVCRIERKFFLDAFSQRAESNFPISPSCNHLKRIKPARSSESRVNRSVIFATLTQNEHLTTCLMCRKKAKQALMQNICKANHRTIILTKFNCMIYANKLPNRYCLSLSSQLLPFSLCDQGTFSTSNAI